MVRIDYTKALPVYYAPPTAPKVEARMNKHRQSTTTFKATLESYSQRKHNQRG